jgi:outer membrane protein
MLRRSYISAAASFLSLFVTSMAFPVHAEAVFSWQQCVKKVVDSNADLAAAVANVKVMQAEYSGSYSNFFPQLSASASYTDSSIAGTVPTPGSLNQIITIQHQYTEALSLNQSIFNGFADVGKVKQGWANYKAAKAQLDAEKATLSSTLKTAYAQLLYEQKAVDLSAAILKRQENNLRMINLRFRGGSENKGSLLFQQATVAQAKYQYEHAIRQKRNAIKQLGALWGEPNITELQVTGDLQWQVPSIQPNFQDVATQNPNHVNYVELTNSADANITIVDGNWYPNLNLVASTGKVGGEWPPNEPRWSAGLTLTFPFFSGTSQIFAAETARAEKMQAEFQQYSTDYKLVAALENAYEGLLDAAAQVEVSRQFQVAAEARSRIANGRYGSGLMTFEDWSVIDADFVTREQNLLQNELNAMQAQATWESAEGIGDVK